MALLALRLALSTSSRTFRPPCSVSHRFGAVSSRSIASTSFTRSSGLPPFKESPDDTALVDEEDYLEDEVELDNERDDEPDSDLPDPSFDAWLVKEGLQFEHAVRPRNWLGGDVPFPLNPSFKPPTPISDALRATIYNQFMTNPEVHSVRRLSERYCISMARVDAILRLKGLEAHMVKGKQLQTGFQLGMEDVLGVKEDLSKFRRHEDWVGSRTDLIEADEVDELSEDITRTRYQRLFWEPTVEKDDPIMMDILEKARRDVVESKEAREEAKSSPYMLGRIPESGRPKVVYNVSGAAPGRPVIKFTDVGGKFLDPKDREERMKVAQRRVKQKAKQRAYRGLMQQQASQKQAAQKQ